MKSSKSARDNDVASVKSSKSTKNDDAASVKSSKSSPRKDNASTKSGRSSAASVRSEKASPRRDDASVKSEKASRKSSSRKDNKSETASVKNEELDADDGKGLPWDHEEMLDEGLPNDFEYQDQQSECSPRDEAKGSYVRQIMDMLEGKKREESKRWDVNWEDIVMQSKQRATRAYLRFVSKNAYEILDNNDLIVMLKEKIMGRQRDPAQMSYEALERANHRLEEEIADLDRGIERLQREVADLSAATGL